MIKWIVFLTIITGISVGFFFFFKKEKKIEPIVYIPYAVWCDGEKEYFDPGETQCSSISRDGEKISSTTVTSGIKFFGDISTTTNLRSLANAIDSLNEKLHPDSVSILENNEYSLHTIIGDIFLQKDQDLENAVENINTFIQVHKDDDFEYLDARHGNSIFFKLKNEKP